MYDKTALFSLTGYVIIVLLIICVIALIVCGIDKVRWEREKRAKLKLIFIYRKTALGWMPEVSVYGIDAAHQTHAAMTIANPLNEYKIVTDND